MKYLKSRDGIMRVTLRAEMRATAEEVHALRQRAKRRGLSLKDYLNSCLRDGVYEDEIANAENEDPTDSNTDENE